MTIAALTNFIAIVLVALCAPARMVARLRGMNVVQLWLLAHGLADMHAEGGRLRYPGETLAVVAARLDLMAWLAFDPFAARTHLARGLRGWRRARLGAAAPPAMAPPASLVDTVAPVTLLPATADTS